MEHNAYYGDRMHIGNKTTICTLTLGNKKKNFHILNKFFTFE